VWREVDKGVRWLAAGSLWWLGGLLFPLLTPPTDAAARSLQHYLSSSGLSGELGYQVAFTLVRVPLTAALGMLVALMQCVLAPAVRPFSRRWIVAAAAGGAASTLIWLPSTLVALKIAGDISRDAVRVPLLAWGAGLLGGLASFLQQRAARARAFPPSWLVAASTLASVCGALAGWLLGF
jgi:hypothetical protein